MIGKRELCPKTLIPKMPKGNKEKRSLVLKVEFSSASGKENDADAKEFTAQLKALISKFKPKSTFRHTLIEKIEGTRGEPESYLE